MRFFPLHHPESVKVLVSVLSLLLPWALLASAAMLSSTEQANPAVQDIPLDLKDRYIITLRDEAELDSHIQQVEDLHARSMTQTSPSFDGVLYRYNISTWQAYAGHFPESVMEQIRKRHDVASIEPDREVRVSSSVETQFNAPYGLNLISHRGLSQEAKGYSYAKSAGKGTYAYVVDTGIDVEHSGFGGRAYNVWTINATDGFTDHVGHGTHVAGIIGSEPFGVAKKTNLLAVKVLMSVKGSEAQVMAGYDWAVKDIIARRRKLRSTINMSIGGDLSPSWNRAVNEAFSLGVLTVIAAGNNNKPVAEDSPASAKSAVAVGATDRSRARAFFSNYGPGITLFAPGVNIVSCWPSPGGHEQNLNRTLSGTSMAAPFITGIAVYLQGMHVFTTPYRVRSMLVGLASQKVVADVHGSPNRFAYNGGGSKWLAPSELLPILAEERTLFADELKAKS